MMMMMIITTMMITHAFGYVCCKCVSFYRWTSLLYV